MMPDIKIKHIVSFSSEDKNFPAENLLKREGTSKWKNGAVGEKQCSVILQFEKATKITQVDIGNDGAAFVEVLVSRSENENDFKVLLVACSFMNPMESRNDTNKNRVRMFDENEFNKTTMLQKWDRAKVVCTQPFNKTTKYGLSFIKFQSDEPEEKPAMSKQKTLGAFALKDESTESAIKPGSIFANRGKKPEPAKLTGAAAVRAASRTAGESRASSEAGSSSASQRTPSSEKAPKEKARPSTPATSTAESSGRERDGKTDKPSRRTSHESKPERKRENADRSSRDSVVKYSDIMKGVVFVMSGFQNPLRGKLRDKATDMGAKYQPDWNGKCTHLICAFANTPKYAAVEGKGKIVKKEWITECSRQEKLIPWRKYRLGDAETPPQSEDEYEPPSKVSRKSSTEKPKPKDEPKPKTKVERKRTPSPKRQDSDMSYNTDDLCDDNDSDDIDTDEEIERIRRASKAKQENKKKTVKKNEPSTSKNEPFASKNEPSASKNEPSTSKTVFEADTDEELSEDETKVNGIADEKLPPLLDIFTDKVFLLFGEFDRQEKRTLYRYITAYNGSVEEYMTDKVTYVISQSTWDDNFDDALSDNPSLLFVKPTWIYACNDKQKLLPHQRYAVPPPE